jgi:tRNA-2-methylthio-N6-dimethylallyladenosine synthase
MNRGYTVGEYREFVARVFEHLPDACLAGDIIVGFPGETDEDFEATCALVRDLPFKNNFIFKYSARPGTAAIDRFPDDIPDEVKRSRNNRLLAVQHETSARVHAAWVGRTVPVLFDQFRPTHAATTEARPETVSLRIEGQRVAAGLHARIEGAGGAETLNASPARDGRARSGRQLGGQIVGRTPGDLIVAVPVESEASGAGLLGSIREVRITESRPLLLIGTLPT